MSRNRSMKQAKTIQDDIQEVLSETSSQKRLKLEKRKKHREDKKKKKEELKKDDPFAYFFGKPDPDKHMEKEAL